MSYRIVPTDNFSRELKRLSKKYPSLKQEIKDLADELFHKPKVGTPLGHNCYKIRVRRLTNLEGKARDSA